MRGSAGGSFAGFLFAAMCAILTACSRPPEEHNTAVEPKPLTANAKETRAEPVRRPARPSETGGPREQNSSIPRITGAERAQNEDYQVALAEYKRLSDEAKVIESLEGRKWANSRIAALSIAFDRKEAAEGFPAAAKWMREQVEGKTAGDFSSEPAKRP